MSATTHILVEVVVEERDGDDVQAGTYLDASLSYMCEVADDQRRIRSYRILKSTEGKL